jgi:low affinity Fe/Cu permease
MARGFNKLCYDYSLDLVSRYQGSNEHFIVIIMNIIIQKLLLCYWNKDLINFVYIKYQMYCNLSITVNVK